MERKSRRNSAGSGKKRILNDSIGFDGGSGISGEDQDRFFKIANELESPIENDILGEFQMNSLPRKNELRGSNRHGTGNRIYMEDLNTDFGRFLGESSEKPRAQDINMTSKAETPQKKIITVEEDDGDTPEENIYDEEVNPTKFTTRIVRLPEHLSDCNPTQSTASHERKNTILVQGNNRTGTEQGHSNNASNDNDDYNEYGYILLEGSKKSFGNEKEKLQFNRFKDNIDFSNLIPSNAKIISSNSAVALESGKEKVYIVLVWNDGTVYQGELRNGLFNGEGVLKHSAGYQITGEFKDGKVEGQAKYSSGSLVYEGNWVNSSPDGVGKETCFGVYEYEGSFSRGKKSGKGILKMVGRCEYEGIFRDNLFNGEGKYLWADGKRYEGSFFNNKMQGKGRMNWPDGRKYFGRYVNNKKEGFGRFVWADGREYIGYWKAGKQHGKGWYIDLNGNKIDTEWEFGERK